MPLPCAFLTPTTVFYAKLEGKVKTWNKNHNDSDNDDHNDDNYPDGENISSKTPLSAWYLSIPSTIL